MGRSDNDSASEMVGAFAGYVIVPAVIAGIAFVVVHFGYWLLLLLVPLAVLVGVLLLRRGLDERLRRRRVAQREALRREHQRQIAEQETLRKEQRQIAEQEATRKKREEREREAARKQCEDQNRRAFAQQKVERKARVDELGERGIKLVEQAQVAVKGVGDTGAARAGWLGDPEELDFSEDIAMIVANLKTAAQLRKLTDELNAIPDHAADDRARLDEATHKTSKLEKQAQERTKLLNDCADQARRIDASLHDERERAQRNAQHDDVASRMDAMLYGVEVTLESPPSDAAEKVMALVAAYKEIKGTIERERRGEREDDDVDNAPAENTSSWGVLAPVNRAWHWAFG